MQIRVEVGKAMSTLQSMLDAGQQDTFDFAFVGQLPFELWPLTALLSHHCRLAVLGGLQECRQVMMINAHRQRVESTDQSRSKGWGFSLCTV